MCGRKNFLETETVSDCAVHIEGMTKTKLTQIALLATALIIGVTTERFNGLSLLALILTGAVAYLAWGRKAPASAAAE